MTQTHDDDPEKRPGAAPGDATPPGADDIPSQAPVTYAEKDRPKPGEIGGYDGPEPTRFGDWEHKGRVTDF